jgi:hypothetical protein
MRTRLVALLFTGLAAVATPLVAAPQASAAPYPGAPPCTAGTFPKTMWCYNTSPTRVYSGPHFYGTLNVGTLFSTPSWFTCWIGGTDSNNNYETWYYTESDDHGWGFVPQSQVHASGAVAGAWYNECSVTGYPGS